jgi:YHS domain-containing protein
MKRKVFFFMLAVAISVAAALIRPGDAAHSIGLIKADGGKVRHGSSFPSGKDRYMLISTATVIPPYRGDVRVVLEGGPAMDYRVSLSRPVIDLGFRKRPRFKDNIIYGLKPMDRLAVWLEMHPPRVDPVCRMAHEEGFIRHEHKDREYAFCSKMCLKEFKENPGQYENADSLRGTYHLAYYDTKTDRPVLSVPINFLGKGEESHGGGQHH